MWLLPSQLRCPALLCSALFSTVFSLSSSHKALVHIFGRAGLPQRTLQSLRAFSLQRAQTLWRTDTKSLYCLHPIGIVKYVCLCACAYPIFQHPVPFWLCYCRCVVTDRGHWLSVLCALLYNGCVLCPVTKLFNYSKLTSWSLDLCVFSLLSPSMCFSLFLCHHQTIVIPSTLT